MTLTSNEAGAQPAASPLQAPTSALNTRVVTAAYYAAFITLGMTVGLTGPVLPVLARHTGTALGGISVIFVTNSLGYMAGTFLSGRGYDRFRGHRLLAAAVALAGVALFFTPLLTSLWLLAFVMALLGFFQGVVDVGGNALLIWLHGPKVGPFMNGLHGFFGVGAFLAPIVVAQITGLTGDIHWVYWLFAIIDLPIALWILALPSPGARPPAPAAGESKVRASPVILALLVAFFFLYVGQEAGYGNWIYSYALALKLADATRAAYLTSTFWGAFALFRLIGVWISTKTSPRNMLIGDYAGTAVGLSLVLLMPGAQWALWAGTVVVGASLASAFATMMTLAEQRLHLTGAVTSWCFVGSGVGFMILPWFIGQIFEPLGATSMMVFIMIDLVLNVLVFALLLRKSQGEK